MCKKRIKYILILTLCLISAVLTLLYYHKNSDFFKSGSSTVSAPPETGKISADMNELKTGRVMFALVLGQSNAANYGEKKYKPELKVYNYFGGKLYHAEDPLLPASGKRGSVWGILGDSLIKYGYFDKAVFIPIAVGSTDVECWSEGRCSIILKATLDELRSNNIKLTHIFWHQGEDDNHENTPPDLYKMRLAKVLMIIRSYGYDAPFYVSFATYSPFIQGKPGGIDKKIRRAQKEFVKENRHVFAGPDTDTITSISDRFDGIHFSESGMKKFSKLWFNSVINSHK